MVRDPVGPRLGPHQRRALEIRRQVGDRLGVALSLNGLGLLQVRRHHSIEARAMFEEALDIFGALREERWFPVVQENLIVLNPEFGRSNGIIAAVAEMRAMAQRGRLRDSGGTAPSQPGSSDATGAVAAGR
jgi:hypothetical protein